jgi:hypothetical protein
MHLQTLVMPCPKIPAATGESLAARWQTNMPHPVISKLLLTVVPAPAPAPVAPAPASVYYANCTAAKAAGAAPLYAGQPGDRSAMDGDKDGVACER